jgi:hypothetical protein
MNDCPLSLWKVDDMPDTNSLIVEEVFGTVSIAFNVDTGEVYIDDTEEEPTNEDRDDATAWVIRHMKAIGVKVNPLEVRDMLWKP